MAIKAGITTELYSPCRLFAMQTGSYPFIFFSGCKVAFIRSGGPFPYLAQVSTVPIALLLPSDVLPKIRHLDDPIHCISGLLPMHWLPLIVATLVWPFKKINLLILFVTCLDGGEGDIMLW